MSELGEHSITRWVEKLKSDLLLCAMIGVPPDEVPDVGNHYDFINRLWLENPEVSKESQVSLHPFKHKPRLFHAINNSSLPIFLAIAN